MQLSRLDDNKEQQLHSLADSITTQPSTGRFTGEEIVVECFQHRHFSHGEIAEVKRRYDSGEALAIVFCEFGGPLGP